VVNQRTTGKHRGAGGGAGGGGVVTLQGHALVDGDYDDEEVMQCV
jgi:hypothetical protein